MAGVYQMNNRGQALGTAVGVAVGAVALGAALMLAYVITYKIRASLPSDVDANTTAAIDDAKSQIYTGFGLLALSILVIAAVFIIRLFTS